MVGFGFVRVDYMHQAAIDCGRNVTGGTERPMHLLSARDRRPVQPAAAVNR